MSAPTFKVLGMLRALTNDFSWSKSRHEKLRDCARAYYLHYYASWGGWELEAPQSIRQLYILKKLSNRYTWVGSLVHEAVKDVLNDIRFGRAVDMDGTLDVIHRRMQRDYVHSMRRAYWREKGRRSFTGLVEHEYAEAVARTEWKASWESVREAVQWFLASRWMDKARSLKREQWIEVDESFETANFALDGVRVFAIPDFAFVEDDGTPVVVDWKTGQARPGYDAQVLGYALYIARRYGFPVEKVRAQLVYLNDGTEQEIHVSRDAAEGFLAHFRESVGAMRNLMTDVERNLPRDVEAFPMAKDLSACTRCVFRRACDREQPALVPIPSSSPAAVRLGA